MKRTKTPNRPKQSGRLDVPRAAWPWAAGLLLLVTAVYWPTLANGFIWDDDANVIDNATLRSLDGLRQMWFVPRSTQQYYPLMYTSYWVEYQLWGLAPLGYHLVNLLLAAVAAVLVWRSAGAAARAGCLAGRGAVCRASGKRRIRGLDHRAQESA